MRALLVVIVLIAILAIVGWISFDTGDGRPSVTLEQPKIEQDIDAMSDSVRAASDELKEEATTPETPPADAPNDVDVRVEE